MGINMILDVIVEDKKKKIKEKALQMIEEYKDQMDADLYEETKKEIVRQAENLEEKTEKKKQTSRTKAKNRIYGMFLHSNTVTNS